MTERDLATEFRAVADALLDRLQPMIARMDDPEAPHWQGCSWCPLCAIAALLRGERHELVTRAGLELDSVLAVVRELLGDTMAAHPAPENSAPQSPAPEDPAPDSPAPENPAPQGPASAEPVPPRSRYRPISVTITPKDTAQ